MVGLVIHWRPMWKSWTVVSPPSLWLALHALQNRFPQDTCNCSTRKLVYPLPGWRVLACETDCFFFTIRGAGIVQIFFCLVRLRWHSQAVQNAHSSMMINVTTGAGPWPLLWWHQWWAWTSRTSFFAVVGHHKWGTAWQRGHVHLTRDLKFCSKSKGILFPNNSL